MSRPRSYIPFSERLAAALVRLLPAETEKELRAARVPAATIIAMFHMDHIVLHAFDGADLWWNLEPKLVIVHQEKSRRDTSIVAKVRRLTKAQQESRHRMLAKSSGDSERERPRKQKIPSRRKKPDERTLQRRANRAELERLTAGARGDG